jgi:ribosomal protein L44E
MTIEMLEDSELQSRAEIELVCPWCHIHSISAIVNHRMLRLRCSECGMDAFVARIPRNRKFSDYISRRLIA